MQTVLQVMEIQQEHWPVLVPIFASLQAQQGPSSSKYGKEKATNNEVTFFLSNPTIGL
jgi:hypothetical protein